MAVVAASEAGSLPREPRRLHAVFTHYPRTAGVFAACVGTITLIGWLAGIEAITRPVPGIAMMVISTAIMSVFAGVSLWLAARPVRRTRAVARIVAAATLLLALATLVEYVARADLGLEALREGQFARWARTPSAATALAFVFIGLALLLIDRASAKGRYVADYLALAAAAIAVLALLGYLFDVTAVYGRFSAVPVLGMSPLTAFVVLALAMGILAAHVEKGMLSIVLAPDAGGIVARQLLAGLAVFPLLAIAVILGARLGWYALPVASALMLFLALSEASVFILSTASRLSRIDGAQRRVANELRASEARVRALVEQAPDGIFVSDLDGRYIDVNPAGCAMLGYTRDELLGKTIADLVSPDDVPRIPDERAHVLAGKTSRGEWELRHRDGSYVSVEVMANIVSGQRWQAFVRDITERKRSARLLAEAFEAERQLRADLEAVDAARATVADAVTGLSGAKIEPVLAQIAEQARVLTNAAVAAVAVGDDAARPFGRLVTAGMSDDVARAISERLRSIGATGNDGHLRIRELSTHSSFVGLPPHQPPIHSFLSTSLRRGGRVIGSIFLANKRDAAEFSERDQRLLALLADGIARAIDAARSYAAEAAHRAWLQSIIDQLPEGVIVIDEHEHPKAINRAMKAWAFDPTVPDRDAWANPAQFDVRNSHGEIVPIEELPIVRALRTGESTSGEEFQLQQPDGSMLTVEASAAPLHDETGRPAGAVVVVHDSSDRKELERLREEWIAVIAHDLRQPVTAIMVAADLLLDNIAPDQEQNILTRLRDAASRLNRMIGDLLDDARIAANRLDVELKAVDIVGVVARAAEEARGAHPNVEFRVDAPAEHVAWIDEQRIEQVLSNLLSNAVKYREPETAIKIEIRPTADGTRVGVFNQGPQIPHDELPELFSRFKRSREARGAKPGVGLGLFICKGLVEAHGGRIWIESDASSTRVYFTVRCPPSDSRDR